MKKLILIGVYGLIILGVSAGGTWFLRQRELDAQAAKEAEHVDVDPLERVVDVTQPLPPEQSEELPVAVRPGEMSVEEIVRYGLGLKAREAAIREREEALRRTETQHRLVLADIEGEQKEVEGLLAQARDQRLASEELLKQASQQKQESEILMKEMETRSKKAERAGPETAGATLQKTTVDVDANVKELVGVMSGLSEEVAAGILRDFANDGDIGTAVEILSKLEERRAAAILDSMKDEKLVKELASGFMEIERPLKK